MPSLSFLQMQELKYVGENETYDGLPVVDTFIGGPFSIRSTGLLTRNSIASLV